MKERRRRRLHSAPSSKTKGAHLCLEYEKKRLAYHAVVPVTKFLARPVEIAELREHSFVTRAIPRVPLAMI